MYLQARCVLLQVEGHGRNRKNPSLEAMVEWMGNKFLIWILGNEKVSIEWAPNPKSERAHMLGEISQKDISF